MTTDTVPSAVLPGNGFCAAAEAYLQRGWRPIPLDRPREGDGKSGKRPSAKDWPESRLTADEAAAIWGVDDPPNLGILTGDASGVVVLDFDDPAVFDTWFETHQDAAQTYAVARDNAPVGRGHLYYRLPDGQAAPPSRKGRGWDFLSTGRQVVAPPSRHHSGGIYQVTQDVPLLPWRDDYLPAAPPCTTPAPIPGGPADGTPPPLGLDDGIEGVRAGARAYAQAALARETASVANTPVGGRNDRLNTAALKLGQLVGARLLTEGEAVSALLQAAVTAGLPEVEATATIFSGMKAGTRQPRTVPSPVGRRVDEPAVSREVKPTPPEPWEDPAPLGVADGGLPPWPWDALPAVLRDMGQAVAETIGVHESMAAAAVLGCASIAAGNRFVLMIKGGAAAHTCRANLYWLVAAPVGAGKTPCLRPCLAPLQEWEAARLPAFRDAQARWKADVDIREAHRSALRRKATTTGADAASIGTALAELDAKATEPPPEPRLFVEDATSEALGRRLVGNRERMGVVSSEGRKVLQIARGRYVEGRGSDLDLWLKAHAGDPHRVDRQGRPPYDLKSPCLSALLFTQPDALGSLGEDTETRESGFLSRFLFVVPPSDGAGEYPTGQVPRPVMDAYERVLLAILGVDYTCEGRAVPARASLGPGAFEQFTSLHRQYGTEINEATRTGNAFFATWLAKLREHVARMALLFAVVEAADGERLPHPLLTVTAAHMTAAATACEHLKLHARRAGGIVGESEDAATARRVWSWLAGNRTRLRQARTMDGCEGVEAVKVRDLLRAGLPGCSTSKVTGGVLLELEARGYLQRVLWQKPNSGSGKKHELWFVHPDAPR